MPLDSQIPPLFSIYTLPATDLALKNGGWKTSCLAYFQGQQISSQSLSLSLFARSLPDR